MIDSNHNRAFHYAVLASLAVHALLLFGFDKLPDPVRRAAGFPPPLIAHLVDPAPAPAPAAPQAEPVKSKAQPAPPPVAKPTPPSKPSPLAKAESKAEAVPTSPPQPVPPASPAELASAAPVAPAAPSAVPRLPPLANIKPGPASTVPMAETADTREKYRLELIDVATRYKRYPPLARENNWDGVVLIGIVVAANGTASVSVKASSGHEVLDRQALEMFNQAARKVSTPPALRGQEFTLEMRVRYKYGVED